MWNINEIDFEMKSILHNFFCCSVGSVFSWWCVQNILLRLNDRYYIIRVCFMGNVHTSNNTISTTLRLQRFLCVSSPGAVVDDVQHYYYYRWIEWKYHFDRMNHHQPQSNFHVEALFTINFIVMFKFHLVKKT